MYLPRHFAQTDIAALHALMDAHPLATLVTHGPDGIFGRPWPTGTMPLWTTLMLGAYLLLAYV